MNKYRCPHCEGYLDVSDHIVFTTRNNKGNRGLILLSKEVGDYTFSCNPEYTFEQGEKFEFYCPLCNTNLKSSDRKAPLARVIMIDKDNDEYEILFSSIAGEHCTYKISKHKTIESYGAHSKLYLDFTNLSTNK